MLKKRSINGITAFCLDINIQGSERERPIYLRNPEFFLVIKVSKEANQIQFPFPYCPKFWKSVRWIWVFLTKGSFTITINWLSMRKERVRIDDVSLTKGNKGPYTDDVIWERRCVDPKAPSWGL